MKRPSTVILWFFFRNQCDGTKFSTCFEASELKAENGGKQQGEVKRTRDFY